MVSGSSRVLWKATNSQNRKTAINSWDGKTTLTPVKVYKVLHPEFEAVPDAQIIDTVKLVNPVDPSVNQKTWNIMRQLPVTVDYMYHVLRAPLCTVAADKETKERLRKIAFAMRTFGTNMPWEPVPRTQRDRLVRLLTRLTGGKHSNRTAASRRESVSCGFDPAVTYRLITNAEMTQLGFVSTVGEAGTYKFFYKATRHGLWSRNNKKYRVREYLAPSPKAGKNGHMPASKPLRVPQRIVQRGLQANAQNGNAPWHRDPNQKWSGTTSRSGVWKGRSATPAPSPSSRRAANSPAVSGFLDIPLNGRQNFALAFDGMTPAEVRAQLVAYIQNPPNARRPANRNAQNSPSPPRRRAATPNIFLANSPGLLASDGGGGLTNAQRRNMLAHLNGSGRRQASPVNSQRTQTNSGRTQTNSGRTTNTSRAGRARTSTPARRSPPRQSNRNAMNYLNAMYAAT
jgi:hypothetical protein